MGSCTWIEAQTKNAYLRCFSWKFSKVVLAAGSLPIRPIFLESSSISSEPIYLACRPIRSDHTNLLLSSNFVLNFVKKIFFQVQKILIILNITISTSPHRYYSQTREVRNHYLTKRWTHSKNKQYQFHKIRVLFTKTRRRLMTTQCQSALSEFTG